MKKTKKLKGFTLIELIVVIAIFSIVMVAATQMILPVSKTMTLADVRDTGSANVEQISKYLEVELSAAEYLNTANYLPSDGDRATMVEDFVKTYYDGVLKKGATVSSPSYGEGQVHVMTIDTNNGQINEYVYSVDFAPGSPHVSLVDSKEPAVNRAIYQNFTYQIHPGVEKYDTDIATDFHFTDFMARPNDVQNTSFTILAKTKRHELGAGDKEYSFSTTATVPLINVGNNSRLNGRPIGTYYVLHEVMDEAGKNPGETGYVETLGIVDQATVDVVRASGPVTASDGTAYGNNSGETYPYSGLCFIYSFGSEMSTN